MTCRRAVASVSGLLTLVLAVSGCAGVPSPSAACIVTVPGSQSLFLDPEQAANAATVAGVARRLGLPDEAVIVALATALQESGLHNLAYGDRDSLGLFQQRPSQGWGTPAQVMTPAYAAAAFYQALAGVPGWADLPVTVAAQSVQRSGYPEAYGPHEGEARILAQAATGEVAAGLACAHLPLTGMSHPRELARAIAAAATDMGPAGLEPVGSKASWSSAFWLVAHAAAYGLTRVGVAGRQWSAASGSWSAPRRSAPGRVGPRLSWS